MRKGRTWWLVAAALVAALSAALANLPDPLAIAPAERLLALTDHLGRSLPSRLAHGAARSLLLVTLVLVPSLVLAVPLGLWAATSRQVAAVWDTIASAVWSLPTLLVGLVVFATLKGEFVEVKYAALGLFNWVPVYRAVRDQSREVRAAPYFDHGRALGLRPRALATMLAWPNVWPGVLPVVALNVATLFEAEFALAFLGLSYPEPTPTLGGMLRQGLEHLHPPLVLWPTLMISVLVGITTAAGLAARTRPSSYALSTTTASTGH